MTPHVTASASLLSQHAAHVLAVGIPVAMVVLGLAWDSWRRRTRRPRDVVAPTSALLTAMMASIGAAVVHVAVIPEHFHESTLYGTFFVVAAVCQFGGAAVLAWSRVRVLALLVAWGNAAIVLVWVVTRVVGIPLGPEAGVVEPVRGLDLTASALELLVVAGCLLALRRGGRVVRSAPAL